MILLKTLRNLARVELELFAPGRKSREAPFS
jgi:hypothetical protein